MPLLTCGSALPIHRGALLARVTRNGRFQKSSYGKVLEMPTRSIPSKALAVEVCDPAEGNYELTVWEDAKADYVILVRSTGEKHSYTDMLYPAAVEGRVCRYRFAL